MRVQVPEEVDRRADEEYCICIGPRWVLVEIIGQNPMDKTEGVKETKLEKYRFVRLGDSPGDQKPDAHDIQNHTMIRVNRRGFSNSTKKSWA
jgi:hypothetical protein